MFLRYGYFIFALGLAWSATNIDDIASVANSCPDGWIEATNVDMGCLKFNFSPPSMNFSEANAYCQREGASLVEIQNEEQFEFVVEKVFDLQHWVGMNWWWTGGSDQGSEGQWYWVSSLTSVGDFLWYPGQPNDGYTGNCMYLDPYLTYHAADDPCWEGHYPICQK